MSNNKMTIGFSSPSYATMPRKESRSCHLDKPGGFLLWSPECTSQCHLPDSFAYACLTDTDLSSQQVSELAYLADWPPYRTRDENLSNIRSFHSSTLLDGSTPPMLNIYYSSL